MKRRRAYTLVETVVVIGLTAVTLSVTAVTMHSLHRAEHRLRDDFQQHQSLKQLVTQLRWDAHESSAAAVTNDQDPKKPARQVTLSMSEGKSIRYAVLANRITREVLKGDSVDHHESFRLIGPNSHWTVDERDGRALLIFHLLEGDQQQSDAREVPTRAIHAAVGISVESKRERD